MGQGDKLPYPLPKTALRKFPMTESHSSQPVSRRRLLQMSLSSTAAGLLLGGLNLAAPPLTSAQDFRRLTPRWPS
jgi:hypothetical protein